MPVSARAWGSGRRLSQSRDSFACILYRNCCSTFATHCPSLAGGVALLAVLYMAWGHWAALLTAAATLVAARYAVAALAGGGLLDDAPAAVKLE